MALQPESIVAVEAEAESALVARAVGGDPAQDPSDRLVEAEWRAIEAERIAEERAEAAADLAEEIAPARAAGCRPWPSLTIATALAAGLLVAVVLNVPRPKPGPVEVAVRTEREAEPLAQNGALPNGALRKAAERDAVAAPDAAALVAAREPQRPAEESRSRDKADELAEPIEVMVRGPEGRAKLFERFAALRLSAVPDGAEVLEVVGPEEAVAAFLADPLGGERDGQEGGQSPRRGLSPGQRDADRDAAAEQAAEQFAAAPPRRILVRVIELPAAGEGPSEP